MRHIVNFSLLFIFATLVISGLFRFFKPFEMVTTRIHVVFGFGMLALVVLHLLARVEYFIRMFRRKSDTTGSRKPLPWRLLANAIAVWVILLAVALWNLPPVPQLIDQSYESKRRTDIFRPESTTAIRNIDNRVQMRRVAQGEAHVMVEILWGPKFEPDRAFSEPFNEANPQIAIWAESDSGAMIETFYVSEEAAFSEGFEWSGNPLRRVDILPLWRNSYTLVNGIDPQGEPGAYSGATPGHSFSVSAYLKLNASRFTMNVEINIPDDTNDFYHSDQAEENEGFVHSGLGQPSVLYSAYIEPVAGKNYYALNLVGHGGSSAEMDGRIFYNTKNLTTAKNIIERVLVRVVTDE